MYAATRLITVAITLAAIKSTIHLLARGFRDLVVEDAGVEGAAESIEVTSERVVVATELIMGSPESGNVSRVRIVLAAPSGAARSPLVPACEKSRAAAGQCSDGGAEVGERDGCHGCALLSMRSWFSG